jgi:hypothetical protein
MYLENLEQLIIWNGGSINLYNFQNYIYLFIYYPYVVSKIVFILGT